MAERAKRAVKKVQLPVTRLGAAMKTAPKLSDSNAARARVDEWLAEIAGTQIGKAIRRQLAAAKAGKIADVIAAVAEASPYLWDLIHADPHRFLALLEADPEAHFAVLLTEVRRAANADNDPEIMRALRRAKAEAALLIALAEIGRF